MISTVMNALIFVITLVLVFLDARSDGTWDGQKFRRAFRFFTVQSNVFCALAALAMCLFPEARWAWMLKYVGTAAVTVTILTVFLILAPSVGSLKSLLRGSELFMHLITPIMAFVSFSFFEKRGMDFPTALLGMLPVILYGVWYLYKVVFAPADKRWEDFYGFNRNGRWPLTFPIMMAGGFAICMILMLLQNR